MAECEHCHERVEWCSREVCVRITPHLVHSATGIGACRGNRTTALADVPLAAFGVGREPEDDDEF